MENIQLLITLSETEGFMTLQKGMQPYYPILAINAPRFHEKRGQFANLQKSSQAQFVGLGISLWDKHSNETKLGFEYFGAKTMDDVDLNAIEFVRKLDIPLLLLDEVKDDKIVVYSTNRGVDVINNFFTNHPSFTKDDLFIVIV